MLTAEENELLCRTGPGTPMGELFRRFWLPVALSSELPGPDCPPVRLRILSEDLVAFRDSAGRIGLLERHCAHRGASLFFGRNEENGLRCVYHGWKYDVGGRCVDMPNEPAESNFREKIRQVAYPVREAGGVIWAYMGPSGQVPELPQLGWMLVPHSHVYVHRRFQHNNYLQNVEGEVDSSHVSFLHKEFQPETFEGSVSGQRLLSQTRDSAPVFVVQGTDYGIAIGARRNWDADQYYWRLTQFLMPSYTLIPAEPGSPISFTAAVPVDDTEMVGFTVTWDPDQPLADEHVRRIESWRGIYAEVDPATFKTLASRDNDYFIDRERQRTQNFTGMRGIREEDVAVQEDQRGPISDRSKEHLGTSDTAVIAMRRRLLDVVQALDRGQEPIEPWRPESYRVVSLAELRPRDVPFDQVARSAVPAL
jgi:phthalate 4,5-dioxygenase